MDLTSLYLNNMSKNDTGLSSGPLYAILKSFNPRNFNTLPFSFPARYTLSLPNNSRQKPSETSPGGFEKSNKPTLAKNNACKSECAYIARIARDYVYSGCVFERIVCISMRPEHSNENLTSNDLFVTLYRCKYSC